VNAFDGNIVPYQKGKPLGASVNHYIRDLESDEITKQIADFAAARSTYRPSHEQALDRLQEAHSLLTQYFEGDSFCYEVAVALTSRTALLSSYSMFCILTEVTLDIPDMNRTALSFMGLTYSLSMDNMRRIFHEQPLNARSEPNKTTWANRQPASPPPSRTPTKIWSTQGRGNTRMSLEVAFVPGIYRFDIETLSSIPVAGNIWLEETIDVPTGSFPQGPYVNIPSQLRVNTPCRIYATLLIDLYSEHANKQWEVSITKLD